MQESSKDTQLCGVHFEGNVLSPAFFNACWFTRPACIVTLYIGAVMSSIAFLFLVDASPAPSEQAFDPHCTCLALFRRTCADTSHTHPWHCWHDPSFFIIIILVLIPALTFSFFFFPERCFYVLLLSIFALSSLFKKCALARIFAAFIVFLCLSPHQLLQA